ncbi:Putative ribosome biogenesis ATPase nvl [Arachis hypogaea]|nr:Putative ribosome biogenesis ATPase nvl [Arachis hypogaea]
MQVNLKKASKLFSLKQGQHGSSDGVLLIGATNRLYSLDLTLRALFQQEFVLVILDEALRRGILKLLTCKLRVHSIFHEIARFTLGYVTTGLEGLVKNAQNYL